MNRFVHLEETITLKLTWDIEIDTNDLEAVVEIPTPTRFGGRWTLHVTVDDPQHLTFQLTVTDGEDDIVGARITPHWAFHWLQGWDSFALCVDEHGMRETSSSTRRFTGVVMPSEMCTASEEDPSFSYRTHSRFRAQFFLKDIEPSDLPTHNIDPLDLATVTQPLLLSSRPDRVRLFFPRVNAELWESASFLSASSPYFETLLDSNSFVENQRRGRKRARTEGAKGAKDVAAPAESTVNEGKETGQDSETRLDDSDEETDDILCDMGLLKVEERTDDDDDNFTYRQITITHASYCTYLAVLLWLHSSYIGFEDLRSSRAETWRDYARQDYLNGLPQPPLASPKSVYRLAHLLELPHLQALALLNLKDQLMVDTAATELFSDISNIYDEVRAVVLDFVVKYWSEIKRSRGMNEFHQRLESGELPKGGPTLSALLRRV